MKEKNSIYMNNYNRELFNQYTPYLQLLKAQQKDLSDRLGKKQFSGTHVYMLPFSSCMDEVEDIFDKVREKYGINDINEVKDGIIKGLWRGILSLTIAVPQFVSLMIIRN
ncbi:MAG: hypothetical protein II193_09485, partial [Lachnospiraceae bacterium]|nr:hypothetical protein [Lachnospiraceae bacterium]